MRPLKMTGVNFIRRILPLGFAILVILGLGGGIFWLWRELCPKEHPPGILITDAPSLADLSSSSKRKDAKGHSYEDLGEVRLRGRVLGLKRYQDQWVSYSPIDVVLGWQQLSDSAVLEGAKISQEGRKYRVDLKSPSFPPEAAYKMSGNFSIIPDNPTVPRFLGDLRTGDLIEIRGHLVNLHGKESDFLTPPIWSSTRSFDLNGPDASFILLVSEIRSISPSPSEGKETTEKNKSVLATHLDRARNTLGKAETRMQEAEKSSTSPAAPSPSQTSLGSAADLKQWYQRLLEAQMRLDKNDPEAVTRFNEEARRYMEAAHPRAKTATPKTTPSAKKNR